MSSIEIPISQLGNNPASKRTISDAETPVVGQPTVGVTTMGCKVNAYESELISEALKTDQWQVVESRQKADLYVINTCTVTQEADRQARREVRRACRLNPDALVIVTGCYAQMDAEACAAIPGVDLVLGNDQKLDLHKLLPQLQTGELPKIMVGDLDEHVSLPEKLLTGYEAQTRAFIQIQQGCDQGCTFCIIHRARGPSRSLAPTLVRRQVERLALNGYPEIVICGVDLGSYGEDFSPLDGQSSYNLVALLKDLLEIQVDDNPDFRIRLSSIDPAHLSDDLFDLMVTEHRLCSQLHLSLQSGNTLILKRMKRRYTREHVYERIQTLRSKLPDLVLSADVMVGFPTETEEQFQETVSAIKDLDIAFPHIFTYSERSGTPAARIPAAKQVPIAERKNRAAQLRETASQLQHNLHQSRLGAKAWVLPEQTKNSQNGRVRQKARSEDYLTVELDQTYPTGKWISVVYKKIDNNVLIAHSCDNE